MIVYHVIGANKLIYGTVYIYRLHSPSRRTGTHHQGEWETKKVTAHFEKGKPVAVTVDSSDDFFKLFGEDVEKRWKETRENIRKKYGGKE